MLLLVPLLLSQQRRERGGGQGMSVQATKQCSLMSGSLLWQSAGISSCLLCVMPVINGIV